jgi:hypothetical protein
MRLRSLLTVLVLSAGCSNDDPRSDTGANGCAPGQQVSCACPGGAGDGVQICEADGSHYGACMGCDEGSTGVASTSDDESSTTATATTVTSTSATTTEPAESTGVPGESSTGGGLFVWTWIDHGGPAFLPPPCAAMAGVADGVLVDPQAFFSALVEGTDPNDWETVMNTIEPQLWACGIGQQRDSQGNVRGRLFLPTEGCPDASPPADDQDAMFFGVRQERACWTHPVDVVMDA